MAYRMPITKESQVRSKTPHRKKPKKKPNKVPTPVPDGEKVCQGCGKKHNLSIHHVYGNSSRNNSSRHNCVVWLCWHCHQSKHGVHGDNKELDNQLKVKFQKMLESKGMTRDKFRYLFGRSYL